MNVAYILGIPLGQSQILRKKELSMISFRKLFFTIVNNTEYW